LAEQLIEAHPQSVGFIHGLAVAYYQIGRIKKSQGDANMARPCFEKAKMFWETLFKQTNLEMYAGNAKVMDQELASIHVRMPTMKELVSKLK
jgi:hypothetical protein